MRKLNVMCAGAMLTLVSAAAAAASVVSINAIGVGNTEQTAVNRALANGELQCTINFGGVVSGYQLVSVQQSSQAWLAEVNVLCTVS